MGVTMNFLVHAGMAECRVGDFLSPLSQDAIEERERQRHWLCVGSTFYLVASYIVLSLIN